MKFYIRFLIVLIVYLNGTTSAIVAAHTMKDAAIVDPQAFLEHFKHQHIAQSYAFHYSVSNANNRTAPAYYGTAWGKSQDQHALLRLMLHVPEINAKHSLEYLIDNETVTSIWNMGPAPSEPIPSNYWLDPLAPQLCCSLFDLAMPFIQWDGWSYESKIKCKGRPAYTFILPAANFQTDLGPKVRSLRLTIDQQYSILLKIEWLDEAVKPLRTFQILNFKKVKDQWFIKSFDIIDLEHKQRTRFKILSICLDPKTPVNFFEPNLSTDISCNYLLEHSSNIYLKL